MYCITVTVPVAVTYIVIFHNNDHAHVILLCILLYFIIMIMLMSNYLKRDFLASTINSVGSGAVLPMLLPILAG